MNMDALTRKIGPLPAYVWVGIAVTGILLYAHLRRGKAAASTAALQDASQATDSTNDGNTADEYANTDAVYPTGTGNDPLSGGDTVGGAAGYGQLLTQEQEIAALSNKVQALTVEDSKEDTLPKPTGQKYRGKPIYKSPRKPPFKPPTRTLSPHQRHLLHEQHVLVQGNRVA